MTPVTRAPIPRLPPGMQGYGGPEPDIPLGGHGTVHKPDGATRVRQNRPRAVGAQPASARSQARAVASSYATSSTRSTRVDADRSAATETAAASSTG